MKKILFFLMTILTILLCGKNVYAETNTFREAEFIDKIYINKYQYSTNTIYYQQARFFRDKSGYYTYCIEPFIFFKDGSNYQETKSPRNLTKEQIDRIHKIIYFGFGYKNHKDYTWYVSTQLLIWKTSAPNDGDYYYTKTLNGERIYTFDYQINEINQLINNFDNEIPIKNKTITLVEGTTKEITIGNSLEFYSTENKEIELKDKKIIIKNLEEGEYTITLKRTIEPMSHIPISMYEATDSQNMVRKGDLDPREISFKVKVIKNHIDIEKLDEDTKETNPQGEAKLDGASFELRDESNNLIQTIEITNSKARINNIPFGKYYLKEIKAGNGYKINDKVYEIVLSENNPNDQLQVTNKVIEKKIIIQKLYGEKESMKPEANIDFEIYNTKKELIRTISTNEEGIVETILPYGEYKIMQINSTDGYQKINPITINVTDDEEQTIKLEDFKIPVPDTKSNNNSILLNLLKLWLLIW